MNENNIFNNINNINNNIIINQFREINTLQYLLVIANINIYINSLLFNLLNKIYYCVVLLILDI